MNTYNTLVIALEGFEARHFTSLASRSPTLNQELVNGDVQFLCVQPPVDKDLGKPHHVIVAIGINYFQLPDKVDPPVLKRHLADSDGQPTVKDIYTKEDMRHPLNYTLEAHHRKATRWTEGGFASDHICRFKDYILVVTNFSPFITRSRWLDIKPAAHRKKILELCNFCHLDDLVELIDHHGGAELWIGHGSATVWNRFDAFRQRHDLQRWINTYNLSGLGIIAMKRAKKDKRYRLH